VTLFTTALLPVFVVLAMGVYAGLRKRTDNRHPEALITLLMQFALPCSLLVGVAAAPPQLLRSQLPLFGLILAVMLITYGVTFGTTTYFGKTSMGNAAVIALTVAFANNVAIGLPFLSSVGGAAARLSVMSSIVAGALVLSPLTLVLLECAAQSASGTRDPLRTRVRKAMSLSLRRPVILAPMLGLAFPLSGHTLPATLAPSLDLLGKATVGVALFLTGLIVSAQPFRFSWTMTFGVAAKVVLQPALMVFMLCAVHLHGGLAPQAFLLSCVPAGFFGTVFGARYGSPSSDAGGVLVVSTVLSAVTLPLAVRMACWIH